MRFRLIYIALILRILRCIYFNAQSMMYHFSNDLFVISSMLQWQTKPVYSMYKPVQMTIYRISYNMKKISCKTGHFGCKSPWIANTNNLYKVKTISECSTIQYIDDRSQFAWEVVFVMCQSKQTDWKERIDEVTIWPANSFGMSIVWSKLLLSFKQVKNVYVNHDERKKAVHLFDLSGANLRTKNM